MAHPNPKGKTKIIKTNQGKTVNAQSRDINRVERVRSEGELDEGYQSIRDEQHFTDFLRAKNLVVVLYSARWCGSCIEVEPRFKSLAKKMPGVAFLKIDVDEHTDVATTQGVSMLPTFEVFKDSRKVERMLTLDMESLRKKILLYGGKAADEKPFVEKTILPNVKTKDDNEPAETSKTKKGEKSNKIEGKRMTKEEKNRMEAKATSPKEPARAALEKDMQRRKKGNAAEAKDKKKK